MNKFFLSFFLLFILIPVSNVFAFEGGFLDENQPSNESISSLIYDNDPTTYISLPPGKHIIYEFPEPVDLIDLYFNGINNSNLRFEYTVEDLSSNYATAYLFNRAWISDVKGSFNIPKIINISLNNISSSNLRVNEIDFKIAGIKHFSRVNNLTEIHDYNTAILSWINPSESIGTIIKKDGVQIADLPNTQTNYTVTGLNSESTYNFEVIAKYSDNNYSQPTSITVNTDPMPDDITPPENIKNLVSSVKGSVVTFTYDLPLDSDYNHLQIYRDGILLEDNYTSNIYADLSLQHNTSYTYKFVSVDTSNNKSVGYITTIKTEPEIDGIAPNSPTNVVIKNGSGSAKVSWSHNIENDLAGYNVYLNGIKANTSLIFANTFIFTTLENGTSYDVQVSAVDTSGNESILSDVIVALPDAESMPIFDMSYDLKDVANGTSSWFTSLWPLLAFSVGITLAFIIAYRVKTLFMS